MSTVAGLMSTEEMLTLPREARIQQPLNRVDPLP